MLAAVVIPKISEPPVDPFAAFVNSVNGPDPSQLAPDGLALLLDKFAIPERLYRTYAGLAGLPPDFASYAATEEANQEWSAPLDTQLRWLETAGLQPGVLDLRANYAVLVARPRPRTSEAAHQR